MPKKHTLTPKAKRLKASLEKETGRLVQFRDRAKYSKGQKAWREAQGQPPQSKMLATLRTLGEI